MKKNFLILSGLFVALLVGLIVYIEVFADRTRRYTGELTKVVPAELPGWQIRDIPLAESEGQLEHVHKVLQFDDFVQRVYRHGDLEVVVYAAYWGAGKVTTADAGTHNPDSCWVNTGWLRRDRVYAKPEIIGGRELLPCEYGVYSKDKYTSYVMFWHLVQGVPQRYEDQKAGWRSGLVGRIERLPLVIEDMKKYGLNQKREQLFIRISANKPFDSFRDDPDFVRLLTSMSGLGLVEGQGWGGNAPSPKDAVAR